MNDLTVSDSLSNCITTWPWGGTTYYPSYPQSFTYYYTSTACDHCRCLDAPGDAKSVHGTRTRPHFKCCKCGDIKARKGKK